MAEYIQKTVPETPPEHEAIAPSNVIFSAGCLLLRTMKRLKVVKIKCPRCGEVNLLPVFKRLLISGPLRCQFCGQLLARPEN